MSENMNVYDFGRELLRTKDLDPVYVLLHEAKLEEPVLKRWLLAYWCFYHVGTASWIMSGITEVDFWVRMSVAARSKDYPRSSERRHFRGENARKSVAFLRSKGVDELFDPLLESESINHVVTAKEVTTYVREWVGFGPWIAFKVADMLERLGLLRIEFDLGTAMYDGSPTEGARLLWDLEGQPSSGFGNAATEWAVERVLWELDPVGKSTVAPPRYERPVNVQEVETILCKWKSYMGGHYEVGKDIREARHALLRFPRCSLSQKLLQAGKAGGLW